MSHPVTHQPHQKFCHTYTPMLPTVYLISKAKSKILPSIVRIIRYSCKYEVLSQCDTLNVSKNIGSHYSVSPQW